MTNVNSFVPNLFTTKIQVMRIHKIILFIVSRKYNGCVYVFTYEI